MTAVRHTTEVMRRAVEHREAGWRPGEIPQLIEREFGVRPTRDTVRRWTNPRYAESTRKRMESINARRWAARWKFNFLERATTACREAFIRRLSAEGVPKQSIAKVCTVLFGEPYSRDQVRYVLERES